MNLTFLGTGTSQGIPVVGCDCEVCQSDDPRDRRLRSSVMFEKNGFYLLIDTTPDLRMQLLSNHMDRIDAICMTHEHNDHVMGIDDVRPVNFKWKKSIPIYTLGRVIEELKKRFHYAFEPGYAARPRLTLHEISAGDLFDVGPFRVKAIAVNHGYIDILGFVVDNVAYLTDVKNLNSNSLQALIDLDILVISALHKHPHESHQTLDEAIDTIQQLKPGQAYITHLSHRMGRHATESAGLPEDIHFAYDGLTISLPS